ncbi:hypothetical protein CDEST_05651 [Colletotrichum destructivum]|uniref:Uncharacterized protein n=1 Tax=Colletotrichum destructivum TaxID=34406 RepID=A0AAX4IB44_9PEZI|nr:hypothetical protein CDEST_05651 [Colletotrichum destructivum]
MLQGPQCTASVLYIHSLLPQADGPQTRTPCDDFRPVSVFHARWNCQASTHPLFLRHVLALTGRVKAHGGGQAHAANFPIVFPVTVLCTSVPVSPPVKKEAAELAQFTISQPCLFLCACV